MKKYRTELDLKSKIFQITTKLASVEVKGDSVELIFASRLMLKELFEGLDEIEEVKDEL